MRGMKIMAIMGLAVALLGYIALAADKKVVEVTNNTGVAVQTLIITFTGTGGDLKITNVRVNPLNPPECPGGVPLVNVQANTATIRWTGTDPKATFNCVANGAVVSFVAETRNGPLGFEGGEWQQSARTPDGPKSFKLDPTSVTFRSTPTLTEWGLIALGLLLAGSLAWMIRRRVIARPAGAA